MLGLRTCAFAAVRVIETIIDFTIKLLVRNENGDLLGTTNSQIIDSDLLANVVERS
jgi:predicted nucleotidyltransferase